ncbi:MAG: glycosyl hydrolase family 28-related protein [Candidatus Sumerlaeaceae bacterium]
MFSLRKARVGLPCVAMVIGAAASALAVTTSGTINVLDHGAISNGQADCTAPFQSALNAMAAEGGGIVFVPAGRYRFSGHINVPAYVCLQGTFQAPPTTTESSGSVLLATEGRGNAHAEPFIVLNRCSTLRGVQVFYPDQKPDQIVEYPWCVRGHGDNISIRDTLLVNPYLGVDFGTFPAGRHFISGLYGMPLKLGLFIDKCLDVGRVENVHFWPFWTEQAMGFTRDHGTAFKIAKTDWEYMRDCFCISYAIGFHFTQVNDGPGNAVLTQCGSDVGPLAVKVDAVQAHAGVSFENGQIMAGVQVMDTNSGPVKFTSCGFWGVDGVTDSHAEISGAGHVSFTACHFTWWDKKHTHAPAIVASGGGLTVNGCEFLDAGTGTRHIELREDVEAAIIQGNRFRSEPRIENRSEGEVIISGNTTGKKTKLQSGLDAGDAQAVASSWRSRMHSAPLTSAPVSLRLASAMTLNTPETSDLRRELLKSITTNSQGSPTSFGMRAFRELAREEGRTNETGPEVRATKRDGTGTETSFEMAGGIHTRFRMSYDDTGLQLHITADEPKMNSLRCAEKARDGKIWTDDCVELFLSPRGVTDRYLQIIVNSAGAWYDGTGDLRATASEWNASLSIRTSRTDKSWSVDMKIPWSDLGATAKAGDRWGADVRRWRFAGGDKEYVSWAKAPLSGDTHHPESFGALLFK